MLENPFSEEFFSIIQSKPPLVQIEAISSKSSATVQDRVQLYAKVVNESF